MYRRVLAISPHTDDVELGCGATLYQHREEWTIRVVALSTGNSHTGSNEQEFLAAMEVLGIRDCSLYSFTPREYEAERQEILDLLIEERNQFSPTMVLCPSLSDVHQDHRTVAEEAVRAFKGTSTTLLGYELPANLIGWDGRAFFHIINASLLAKVNAIKCYKSQRDKPYMTDAATISLAKIRGLQIRREYAEAFEALRVIL